MDTKSETKNNQKTVLITGASRGIGLDCVRLFREHGFKTIGCARSLTPELEAAASQSYICDVRQPDQVRELARAVAETFSTVDVLINNAGAAGAHSLADHDDEHWFKMIDTNLHGTYFVARYFAPLLCRPGGRIINISSVLGVRGASDQPGYCAAKHGVVGLTKSLAGLYGPEGITSNAICPGWTETEMFSQRLSELNLTKNDVVRQIPTGKITSVRDVAELALFLSSAAASQINGQAIIIDGGLSV